MVLVAEGYGKDLTTTGADCPEEVLSRALQALISALGVPGGPVRHRLTVATWNGRPGYENPGATVLLRSLGFRRGYQGMTRYAP